MLNTVNWIFFKTASSGGLFAVPKTWVFRITSIFYLPVMVYSSTEVPGLKTHIYLIPGRALFNQEKSKLMQTKGQLSERFWSCFFVCTTFDSFLNDLHYSLGKSKSSSVHFRIICFVFSIGSGTASAAKYSFFTTSTTASWLSLPAGTIT